MAKQKGYSLRPVNGVWTVRFYFRPPGAPRATQYSRGLGVSSTKREPSDALVRKALDAFKIEIHEQALDNSVPPSRTALVELLDDYHEHQRANCSEGSQHPDEQLRNLLASLGLGKDGPGDRPLMWKTPKDITRADLQRCLNARRNGGTAAATCNILLRNWRSFAGWLVENEHLPDNPVKGIRKFKGKKNKRSDIIEPEGRIERLLAECRRPMSVRPGKRRGLITPGRPDWLYPAVFASLHTGLRARELKSLLWEDIDMERSEVHVRRGKGDKERTIPLHPNLRAYLSKTPKKDRTGCVVPGFPYTVTRDGKPNKGYRRAFRTACTKAGVPEHIHWHNLRDTFASYALMGGVPLVVVSAWLGHANVQTTRDHYLSFAKEYEDDMIGRLSFGAGTVEDLPDWSGKRKAARG